MLEVALAIIDAARQTSAAARRLARIHTASHCPALIEV